MPLIVFMILLVFEMLRVVIVQSSLTYALADVARQARLNNDLNAMQQKVAQKAQKLAFIDVANVQVNLLARADSAANLANLSLGNVGRYAIYEVSYPIDSFIFNGWGWQGGTFKQRYLVQREN